MRIVNKKPMFKLLSAALVLFLSFINLAPYPAKADVGVQPILPGGSNIQPEVETPIEMAAEKVVMTVRQATEADNALILLNPDPYGLQFSNVWFPAIADVQADFTMHNPTGETISMTVWFPLASALQDISWEINTDETVPRIESFKVSAGGIPVEYAVSEMPNPKGTDRPLLPWASFPIKFAAEVDTDIQVSYLVPLVPSIKGSPLALYYVFQTGASWAGSIGQAELIVNLPYPASAETIADLSTNNLGGFPYIFADDSSGLPAGAILDGNQARWVWKDFEPGPEDDFSIWVIDPAIWLRLEDERAAVQADPENADEWLRLASEYHSLANVGYNIASVFSSTYIPLATEAYQKVASLLPDYPDPHNGLGLLMLSPYMRDADAPPEVMASVQSEYSTCVELASKPPYAESSVDYCWQLAEILSMYSQNVSFHADESTKSTASAQQTLDASIVQVPTFTTSPENTPTSSPAPTNTSLPLPSVTPTPIQTSAGGPNLLILAGVGIVAIILVGYVLSRRITGRKDN